MSRFEFGGYRRLRRYSALIVVALLVGCNGKSRTKAPRPPVSVVTTTPKIIFIDSLLMGRGGGTFLPIAEEESLYAVSTILANGGLASQPPSDGVLQVPFRMALPVSPGMNW